MVMSKISIGIAALGVIIIVAAAGFYLYSNGSSSSAGSRATTIATTVTTQASGSGSAATTETPITMTDPAQVPAKTQALIMSYSSLEVYETNTTGVSTWVSATGSGMVNLTSLSASGQIIGYANLTPGYTVSQVRFDVNSAFIVVNGTIYSVSTPPVITAQVTGQTTVSQNSTVIVDTTPVVAASYTQNTTAFVMSSSAFATVAANTGIAVQSSAGQSNIGAYVSLNANASAALKSSTPNITILAASVASAGNSTSISVTVQDRSNVPVTLDSVVLYGQQNITTSASANSNVGGVINVGGTIVSNANASLGISVGANLRAFQQTAFNVESSGSLALVTVAAGGSNAGVTISPGSAATLNFSGTMSYDSGYYYGTVYSGKPYTITVTGQNSATASATVTAT